MKSQAVEKTCPSCKKVLPISMFYFNTGNRKRICSWCKECCRNRRKKWYLNNKDKANKTHKEWLSNPLNSNLKKEITIRYKNKIREQWKNIFISRGLNKCSLCGYNKSFFAIDLHHLDPKEKEIPIALLTKHKPTDERIKELEKCISLCANCHREHHHKGGENG